MNISIQNRIGFFTGFALFTIIVFYPVEGEIDKSIRYMAACAVLMAIWWLTEVIPLPVTALLPLVLFPLLKIMKIKEIALSYADSNIFLFMGGFLIAIAMQRHNLHKRIALNIIYILGTSPKKIILGFMISTAFLSMWISNTATSMMMLPIGIAVIEHFKHIKDKDKSVIDFHNNKNNLGMALMLGIAYSASIGGVGTLIGTPPNIIFTGIVKTMFPELPDIDFIRWMSIGIPIVLIFLPLTWLYLVYLGAPVSKSNFTDGKLVIKHELKLLGKMTKGEVITLTVFCITCFGWIFRKNIQIGDFYIPGWANITGVGEYVNDATVAMFGALLLFIIPVNFRKNEFVLNWEWAKRIPWGILILFGGGFALAAGFQSSGLDKWIGNAFSSVGNLSSLPLIVSVCLLLTFLTEITSNTATITMILPVLASMSMSFGINPFILMIPATISTSCAFMMPVATPPNAIVFGSGYLKIQNMAKIGLVLNFVGVVIITLVMYLIAFPLLGLALY